jgi:hypothetical protein
MHIPSEIKIFRKPATKRVIEQAKFLLQHSLSSTQTYSAIVKHTLKAGSNIQQSIASKRTVLITYTHNHPPKKTLFLKKHTQIS